MRKPRLKEARRLSAATEVREGRPGCKFGLSSRPPALPLGAALPQQHPHGDFSPEVCCSTTPGSISWMAQKCAIRMPQMGSVSYMLCQWNKKKKRKLVCVLCVHMCQTQCPRNTCSGEEAKGSESGGKSDLTSDPIRQGPLSMCGVRTLPLACSLMSPASRTHGRP